MNGNAVESKIANLKERMAACQIELCALLDETLALGLKWHLSVTVQDGKHISTQTLIREY